MSSNTEVQERTTNAPRSQRGRAPRHNRPRKILSPIAFFLRTRDDTDTVDRLFVSKHVNDLRLIAAAAFVALGIVLLVALFTAVNLFALDWDLKPGLTHAQELFQRVLAGGASFLKIFAPVLAAFGAVLAWAYQVGSARLGVVDLFACEIDTLCRVITVTGMVGVQAEKFDAGPLKLPAKAEPSAEPADHFSSQENYFPILDSNSRDLQTLEANVVINITAFYTFMKAVRDTFRKLADAQNNSQWKESMRNAIYMLYLALESGRKAMDDLVEFEPTHTERTMVILLSEMDAYYFLREHYSDPKELHHERLILRGPEYTRLINKLTHVLDRKQKELFNAFGRDELRDPTYEESQWYAALQLRDTLAAKYHQLSTRFSLRCAASEDGVAAVREIGEAA